MHFLRLFLCGLVLSLGLVDLSAQDATEEQIKKALELLRQTEVDPTNKPAEPMPIEPVPVPVPVPIEPVPVPIEPVPVPIEPVPIVPDKPVMLEPEAPKPAVIPIEPVVESLPDPDPVVPVIPYVVVPLGPDELEPAPMLDPAADPEEKKRRLKDLLGLYWTDEITSAEYQKRRYQILGLREDAFAHTVPIGPVTSRRSRAVSGSSGAGLEAALVSGADLVLRFDVMAARNSPSYVKLNEMERAKAGFGDGAGGPDLMAMGKRIEAALGLKQEDVNKVLVSADLDMIKASPMGMDPKTAKNLMLVVGVEVAKDVTLAQLKEGIMAMAKEAPEPKEVNLVEKKIGKVEVLAVTPETEDDPEIHMAVTGGKTVLIGLNKRSLSGALDRVSGQVEKLEAPMAAVMGSMPTNAQVKMVLVIPAAIKKMMSDMAEMGAALAESGAGDAGEGGPGGGMGMLSMLGGLKDIKSISFATTFADGVQFDLMGDMGSAETAMGINMLVSMIKPQVIEGMAEQMGREMSEIDPNAFKTSVDQGMLKISVSLAKEMLEAAK